MPRLSTLSNPTELVEIDRRRVNIVVEESKSRVTFSLPRLDLSEMRLPDLLHVVVIARRGNAEERFELGPAGDWNRKFIDIDDMGAEGVLRFRLLLVRPGDPKIVASAENIRAEGVGDSESFIALEPCDLGQRLWDIAILEQEGRAVVQINKLSYLSAAEAEADRHFVPLVMPEAVRRLAVWHSENIGALDEQHWEPFKTWLAAHGITDEPDESDSPDKLDEWCRRVVGAFCDRWGFAEKLREFRTKGSDE